MDYKFFRTRILMTPKKCSDFPLRQDKSLRFLCEGCFFLICFILYFVILNTATFVENNLANLRNCLEKNQRLHNMGFSFFVYFYSHHFPSGGKTHQTEYFSRNTIGWAGLVMTIGHNHLALTWL